MNKAATSDFDAKIQRGFYITIGCVIALPILIYGIFTKQYPTDPDFIYVPAPNLFAAKWEKVGESDTFSQYLNKSKIIKKDDQTISVLLGPLLMARLLKSLKKFLPTHTRLKAAL